MPYLRAALVWFCYAHLMACHAGDRLFQTLPPKDFDRGYCKGKISLRVAPSTVARGGRFKVSCEMWCSSGASLVYNGCLAEHHKLPAQIVITSVDGKVRRELLRPTVTKDSANESGAWVFLRGSEGLGKELVVQVGPETEAAGDLSPVKWIDLPPGEYRIQAVYNLWLFAVWPNNHDEHGKRLTKGSGDEPVPIPPATAEYMERPIAISEPVKFIVEGEAQSKMLPPAEDPLRVDLRLAANQEKFGHRTSVEIRMVNESNRPLEVYDPLLNGLLWSKRAVVLAMIDSEGAYLGDLLHRKEGSSIQPSRENWVSIPPGGIVGTTFRFNAGKVPIERIGIHDELPLGKYFLQALVHDRVLSGRPDLSESEAASRAFVARARGMEPSAELTPAEAEDVAAEKKRMSYGEWRAGFPGPEIYRSKRVELEILPRTGD